MSKPKQPKSNAKYSRENYQRMREAGLVRVPVWVPEIARDQFMTAYEALRRQWKRMGLM